MKQIYKFMIKQFLGIVFSRVEKLFICHPKNLSQDFLFSLVFNDHQ